MTVRVVTVRVREGQGARGQHGAAAAHRRVRWMCSTKIEM